MHPYRDFSEKVTIKDLRDLEVSMGFHGEKVSSETRSAAKALFTKVGTDSGLTDSAQFSQLPDDIELTAETRHMFQALLTSFLDETGIKIPIPYASDEDESETVPELSELNDFHVDAADGARSQTADELRIDGFLDRAEQYGRAGEITAMGNEIFSAEELVRKARPAGVVIDAGAVTVRAENIRKDADYQQGIDGFLDRAEQYGRAGEITAMGNEIFSVEELVRKAQAAEATLDVAAVTRRIQNMRLFYSNSSHDGAPVN